MKLFFYYAFCSVKNQIKKLFRTWVAIFLAVCMLFGVAIGLGVAAIENAFSEEELPQEETEEVLPEEDWEDAELDPALGYSILGLAVTGIVAVVLFFNLISADKNGSAIFIMPDVNLLFSAPMKPQSVLLFRLMSQIFVSLFASVYLLFQLPSIIYNLSGDGMEVALIAGGVFLIWILLLAYGKLLNILVYTVTSTHVRLKKYIRPCLYGLVFAVAGIFFLYHFAGGGGDWMASADGFFNSVVSRWIPVVGWLKGALLYAIEGVWWAAAIELVLLLGGVYALAVAIWHIRADFYEDAMTNSQETAEQMAAVQSGGMVQRKKERTDRVLRDKLDFGSGAQMFFCKNLYNRFRFAILKVFTKTSIFYLVISVGITAVARIISSEDLFPVVGLALCVCAFFRSMGNPMASDVEKVYFTTVPASPYAKVFWSLLAGTVDCALDLLPAMVLATVAMGASPVEAVAYFLLAVAVDFYASNTMLFLELSLPSSLALQIKQAITIMFVYFGLLPIAAVVVVGALLEMYLLFLFLGAVAAAAIGGIFFAFSPMFLQRGRK